MDRLRLDGARVIFKNFRGQKGIYNSDGSRTFSLVIEDPARAADLMDLGWALKPLKDEDGNVEAYHLPVKINFDSRQPPRVYKVSMSNSTQVQLDEKTIDMLDYLPIDYVDIILNPYQWTVNKESGVKAYCQSMYVIIEEDELDLKYAKFNSSFPFEE